MKKIILLALGFASILYATAQTNLPPAYVITSDTTNSTALPDLLLVRWYYRMRDKKKCNYKKPLLAKLHTSE